MYLFPFFPSLFIPCLFRCFITFIYCFIFLYYFQMKALLENHWGMFLKLSSWLFFVLFCFCISSKQHTCTPAKNFLTRSTVSLTLSGFTGTLINFKPSSCRRTKLNWFSTFVIPPQIKIILYFFEFFWLKFLWYPTGYA